MDRKQRNRANRDESKEELEVNLNRLYSKKNLPSCISYGMRLQSEILGLKRKFGNLEASATTYLELPAVESFLLQCGQAAYSGKEMYAALDIRQKLVNEAMKVDNGIYDFELVKQRAHITNLMISRDVTVLKAQIEGMIGFFIIVWFVTVYIFISLP